MRSGPVPLLNVQVVGTDGAIQSGIPCIGLGNVIQRHVNSHVIQEVVSLQVPLVALLVGQSMHAVLQIGIQLLAFSLVGAGILGNGGLDISGVDGTDLVGVVPGQGGGGGFFATLFGW